MELVPWYLQLGKRLSDPGVFTLLQRWEFLEKRGVLVDNISILRQAASAAITDADLLYALQHLFLEHRSGMRTALTCNSKNVLNAANVVKAILARRSIYVHLTNTFPKCADAIEEYASFTFYKTHKSVDITGLRIGGDGGDADADADGGGDGGDDDGDDAPPPTGPNSVHYSRQLLIKFCHALASGRHERTLIKMCKDTTSNTLDLTGPSAKPIKDVITNVLAYYTNDYAVVAAKPSVVVHASGGSNVSVQVVADELTDVTYKEKLSAWEQGVKKYEEERCNEYLHSHMLGYVIDNFDDDGTRAAQKVKKLMDAAGVGKGVKRKLFLHDELTARPADWKKAKKEKKSVFRTTEHVKLDSADLDPVFAIYELCKDDATGSDVIAVVTTGPPANTAVDKSVMVAHARMKKLSPKHQKPKIGSIEISGTEVLQRVKSKNAFVGQNEHKLTFTTQSTNKIQRKSFSVLKGDTYFNKSTYLLSNNTFHSDPGSLPIPVILDRCS